MTNTMRFGRMLAVVLALLALSALMLTPAYAVNAQAQSLGFENPNKTMTVQVMLNLHNKARLDALVKDQHDKHSPNYKKFLTRDQFAAQFAPTAADAKAVSDYLKAEGLTVTRIDKNNLFVTATGTAAKMQTVFNTQIEKMQLNGQTFNRTTSTPAVPPSVAPLVHSIGGLHTMKAKPYIARPIDVKNNTPIPAKKFNKNNPHGIYFAGDCFSVSNSVYNLHGTGLQATYSGNGYPSIGCGYSAHELQHAYGFDGVISGGLDGTGQIVYIVDAYGSNSILNDANAYSAAMGLPPLVQNSNFYLFNNPVGNSPDCVVSNTQQCGWELEVTLDVEMVHAMAPGATIVLITSPTAQFYDFIDIDYWITQYLPVGPASHSYGAPESEVWYFDFPDYDAQYTVNEIADSMGYAYNYSTGDSGDFYGAGVVSSIYDVSFPSGSPNATAVGGTSLALTSTGGYKWEEGWGTNATWLNFAPPLNFGFQYGAGGGTSQVTGAPPWQSYFLGATWRQQPDIAMDADPFTGAEIIYTGDFIPGDQLYIAVEGGTSMSCPMFTGVWALVEQLVGDPHSGNAAPYQYILANDFPGSIHDVVPVGSGHNAHGTIFYGNTPVAYSQWDLAQPYQNSPTFYEALWSPYYLYTLTFGTDSSLTTNVGWDNVTGVGTPNGVNYLSPF